jgi:hypothetical protein
VLPSWGCVTDRPEWGFALSLQEQFAAGRRGGEALLGRIHAEGGAYGRVRKFLYLQIMDAIRSARAIEILVAAGLQDSRIMAKSAEVLMREMLEQLIVASYVAADPTSGRLERFRKTSAEEWMRSWNDSADAEDIALEVKRLPTYTQMAREVDERLFEDWAKLSHLAHPKSALPYSLVENGNLERGISVEDFYQRRVGALIDSPGLVIQRLVSLYENYQPQAQEETSSAD